MMTKRGFGKRLALGAIWVTLSAPIVLAQQGEAPQKVGKPLNAGDVLSGELNALKLKGAKPGQPSAAYQLTSEPRRLPPPSGLCNLETGPETFQLVTASPAQVSQLKGLLGKQIAVKVDEVACAQAAGQISEAVVTKWSLVKR
jgi:phage terminase large subunit-like protein